MFWDDNQTIEWTANRVRQMDLVEAREEKERVQEKYYKETREPLPEERSLTLYGFWIGYLTYHIQELERQEEIKVNRASIIEA